MYTQTTPKFIRIMTLKSNTIFKKSTGVLSLLLTISLLSTSCNNETTTVDVMNKHHLP